MYVQGRPVLADGDVAEQRNHLCLLVHRDARVLLGVPVEIAEHGVAEGADTGDGRRLHLLVADEARERGDGFVVGV